VNQKELIPHLFRTEFSKISTVLVKRFGIEHIEAAEDIASETFLQALETWTYKGIPENPVAWLYTVAKNKTRNFIQREQIFREKIVNAAGTFSAGHQQNEIDLSEKNITDSQLQMLFALCHPSIPVESQIGLALRILCGFGIDEIANAFLTNTETISKRLFRAKEKLRVEKIKIEFPSDHEISNRLETVLTTLYLLYSEGYYSESQDAVIREELCAEAMRLNRLLIENPATDLPAVNALYALMCFHASRFTARKNETGQIILFHNQDETRWNRELITQGAYHLHRASTGEKISKYHLEAGIAYWHTIKADTKEKWESILQLYNRLLQVEYSPIAALNRTFALSKVNGKQKAISEAEKLHLTGNHYYYTLLGELYLGTDNAKAKICFETALSLSRIQTDKLTIQGKIDGLRSA
jgi:RNA polymerase sigma factor (sigma-70 family)